jgi:hypothetical protein
MCSLRILWAYNLNLDFFGKRKVVKIVDEFKNSSEFGNSDLVPAPVFGGNQTTFLVRRDAKSGDRVVVFSPPSQQHQQQHLQQQQLVSTSNGVATTTRTDEITGL